MPADIGQLLGTLFLGRDIAHRAHLKTRSYAKHVALDGFYTGIVDLTDALAEMYQGRFNKLVEIPLLSGDVSQDIVTTLSGQLDLIQKSRYKAVPREESALQNQIDEIEGLYMATLYKLRFLS